MTAVRRRKVLICLRFQDNLSKSFWFPAAGFQSLFYPVPLYRYVCSKFLHIFGQKIIVTCPMYFLSLVCAQPLSRRLRGLKITIKLDCITGRDLRNRSRLTIGLAPVATLVPRNNFPNTYAWSYCSSRRYRVFFIYTIRFPTRYSPHSSADDCILSGILIN